MSIYVEKRPFTRGMRLGWQTLRTIFDNFFALVTKINVEHDAETGEHRTRKVSIGNGNYVYNSGLGQWDLSGFVGNLPAIGLKVGSGQCKLVWPSDMGNPTNYSITVTCHVKSGTEVLNWSIAGKSGSQAIIIIREQGAPGALYDGDFDIDVHKEP